MDALLFHAHSGIRYLVLLLGIAAFLYPLFGWSTKRPYGKPMRILAASFAGFLHLQILLGLGLLLVRGFYPALMGHITMMIFAAVAAQVPVSVMKRRPQGERTHLPHAVATAIALALVVGGILAIGRPVLGTTG